MLPTAVRYWFPKRFQAVRYVKLEIARAYSWDEYVFWKLELSALRWSLIPGITPDRVKQIRRFFHKINHSNHSKKKSDGIVAMIMPSISGIFVCAVCLIGCSYLGQF